MSIPTGAFACLGLEDEEHYEVEYISDHRISQGIMEFKIYWVGYPESEAVWIPESKCDCDEIILEYLYENNIHTAYIFCRVSTPEQANANSISLAAQELELREYLNSTDNDYQRIKCYSISESAYRRIPKVLRNIGQKCNSGDGIFVWRIDRLSRNIEEYMEWLRDLERRGVALYSYQENLSYPEDKLQFFQGILDAQKESYLIGRRIKMAYEHKRTRGDERVGRLPYGKRYKRILNIDGTTLKLIVEDNPEEQAVIQRIKDSDISFEGMAKLLNDEGVKKGKLKWTVGMIKRIKQHD